ncbi:MAG: DNA repair protein RecO [Phycisphaerae bacterium]
MGSVRDLAVVLRRLDYSETSQVLAAFGRATGLQRLIAKGAKRGTKKRFATGIDLLELGDVIYLSRAGEAGLGTLTEWTQRDSFPAIRASLEAWYAAQYAADRTAQALEESDPHPGLFDALVELLSTLDANAPLAPLTAYAWTLLREIGLQPALDRCVGCGAAAEPGAAYFSARQGGLLCRDCEPAHIEKRRVSRAALDLLRRAAAAPDPAALDEAWQLLDYALTETLGRPSRVTIATPRRPTPPRK